MINPERQLTVLQDLDCNDRVLSLSVSIDVDPTIGIDMIPELKTFHAKHLFQLDFVLPLNSPLRAGRSVRQSSPPETSTPPSVRIKRLVSIISGA